MNMLCIPHFNCKCRKLIGQNKVIIKQNFSFYIKKLVGLLITNNTFSVSLNVEVKVNEQVGIKHLHKEDNL